MASVQPQPLPMREAIEYWRTKVPLPEEEFYRLADEARVNAFTVADVAALDILMEFHQLLQRALEEGLTLEDFRREANQVLERRGWTGLTPYRADTIFRTNLQTAYAVGRYRQMTDPDVLQARPYWMYDAVNDRRTRPTHAALDGTVRRADDPFWDTWYPPNGFRCRCTVRSLSEREVQRLGLAVETGPAPAMVEPPGQPARPLIPDRGFDRNPAKDAWEPDLSRYPEPFRQAYEARRRARQQEGL